MSLFDQAPGSPAPTAPTPPPAPPPQSAVSAADYAAQVEEEKRRLLAAQPVSASYGFCARCGAALSAVNASRLADGVTVVHMDCPQAQTQPPSPPLRPTPPIPPPAPPAAPSAPPAASPAVTVNPPDQPKASSLLDAAAPLPPEEIAKITDPALKAKVEEHARQHAERAAAEARRLEQEKIAAGTSAWCAVNKQRMLVDSAMSVNGYTCQCTRHWTLKALEPVKEGDQYFVVIPRHKPKNKASQQAANGQVNGQVNGAAQSQQQSLPGTAAPAPEAAPASGWSSRDDLALKVGRGLLDAIDQYIAALTSTFDDEIEGVD